jgi:hypothetical protein
MLTNQTSEMLTNQTSEMSQTRAETSVIPESVKRNRMESPLKTREVPQKRPKNELNQILMIEDQKSSEVNLLDMIKALTTRIIEQENLVTVMKAQIVSLQKELKLAQKSINTAPLASQPPLYKEKVISPVTQPPSKMTVEEDQLKEREGFDYGKMKGNEGWTTAPEKEKWTTVTREKSISSKKVERTKKEVIGTAAPVKSLTKDQPTPYREAVQREKQLPQMSQSEQMEKIKKDIETVDKPCLALLQKVDLEKVEEIVSMTLRIRLNSKAQIFPLESMRRIIVEIVGIKPLNLSLISPTSIQILFKKGDSAAFQKLMNPDTIQLVEPKRHNLQVRDINRLAQLYLRGYFKELAQAAIQDLPVPVVQLVLQKAMEIVKLKCPIKILQKKRIFQIQRVMSAYQPVAMETDESS